MSAKSGTQVQELFQEALKNYGQALQAGLKMQEDTAKWWTDFMAQANSPQEWQTRMNKLAADAIPQVQQRIAESLKTIEQTSRASLDLLQRACQTAPVDSVSAAQAGLNELWESSLQAMRQNAQAITQANSKVVESWLQCWPQARTAAAKAA
jgi:hypothetical protein